MHASHSLWLVFEPFQQQIPDQHSCGHIEQDFIKSWHYQEYYDKAMEALEELSALLPALEVYSSDSYVSDMIKTARSKIQQAEANIPLAKTKFESAPLRESVSKAGSRLDVRSLLCVFCSVLKTLSLTIPPVCCT